MRRRTSRIIPLDRTWTGPAVSTKPLWLSFEEAVKLSCPMIGWTPTRTVTFTTKAGLDAAVSGLQDGDLVKYTGTGVLAISSSTTNAYEFNAPSVATKAVFDFGSYYDPNHVKFDYTSTSAFMGAYILNPNNIWFMGGEYISAAREGILWVGGTNSGVWGAVTHSCGGHGLFAGFDSSHLTMSGCSFLWESFNNNQNPTADPHGDNGGGWHEGLIGDSGQSSTMSNCLFMVYGHDTNLGSCVEFGDTATVPKMNNNTLFIKAENNQYYDGKTDAPGIGFVTWGSGSQSGNIVELLQVKNYAGRATFCDSLTTSTTGCVTVRHARAISTNQNTAGISAQDGSLDPTLAFDTRKPTQLIHQDCIQR